MLPPHCHATPTLFLMVRGEFVERGRPARRVPSWEQPLRDVTLRERVRPAASG